MTWTLTTSPTRPPASAPASTAARTAATSPRTVIATRPLPTLCCSTNVTFAAFSAASSASTAATMPLVSISPIASPFAIFVSSYHGFSTRAAWTSLRRSHGLETRVTGGSVRTQHRFRLFRDDQFFVGRDRPDLAVALDGADLRLLAAHVVLRRVQHDAGEDKVAADCFADVGGVLADASRERDDVTTAEDQEVRAEVVAHRFHERIDREARPFT